MRFKFVQAFIALLASIGLFAASPVYPVQAAPIANCDDGRLCLYDGTNYGTYNWTQYDISWIATWPNGCLNLPSGYNNNISSFILNPTENQKNTTMSSYYVRMHMNANCAGYPTPIGEMTEWTEPNLTVTDWGNVSNAITSISIRN